MAHTETQVRRGSEDVTELELAVSGMTCGSCAPGSPRW